MMKRDWESVGSCRWLQLWKLQERQEGMSRKVALDRTFKIALKIKLGVVISYQGATGSGKASVQ